MNPPNTHHDDPDLAYLENLLETYGLPSSADDIDDAHIDTTQAAVNFSTNDVVGSRLPVEKPQSTFRIFGCNTNGINLGLDGGNFAEICEEMRRFQADMWGLFEINLDTTNSAVRTLLFRTIRRHHDHSKLIYSSSSLPAQIFFKPGGTLLATVGSTTGRVIEQGADILGRWSYQVLGGRNRTLTVISAYQVCAQPLHNTGGGAQIRTFTASAQQYSLLRQQGRFLTPRDAFVRDLQEFINQRQQVGSGILLFGDFNDPLSNELQGMTKLCSDCGLSDLMHSLVGHDQFSTFVKGLHRINYVRCSHWVKEAALLGCYEPFKYRVKGDHRAIVVDFNLNRLFGNDTQRLARLPHREFSSKDYGANRTYIEHKYKYLSGHRFEERLQQLWTAWDPTVAEALDRDFQRASHHAAKRCQRKPNVPYVQKLAEFRARKNVLLRMISQHQLGQSFDRGIAYQVRDGHTFTVPDTLAECQSACRECQREIHKMEKDAVMHRQNEQHAKYRAAVLSGDKATAKAIQYRMAAERTKAMYAKIRCARGNEKNGLTRLEVPRDPDDRDYNACNDWITLDTPAEIEERLLAHNRVHFGQAKGTFPTIPPFSEWVDWGASSHTAELILEGRWHDDELDELSQCMLKHMAARTTLNAVTDLITVDEWIEKIKSWPERTTTYPSGFHLTHSKALVASHGLDVDTEEGAVLEYKCKSLVRWQVDMLNLAIANRYSYSRWQTIVNVMLLKAPNNFCINRLRVIHLYEQDYNLLLALKWRKMIQLRSQQQLLHGAQFGGVPGRDAVIPTMIEEFQYEISWASKRPLVHMDYNATACYDRIVMSFGGLASRAYGQNKSIVFINAATLSEAMYYLKTQLGVSEAFYKHCTILPIYGSGQGAGNSPALWCVISSVLFHTYEEQAHGAIFLSPDGKISTHIYMIGFVDDTSGSINNFDAPSARPPEDYVTLAQHDAQRWHDVLRLSEGTLQDAKCSYHFLYFTFTVEGLPVLRGGQFGPKITITTSANQPPTSIKQLSTYTAHKTLGVHKAPANTRVTAFKKLSEKNDRHVQTMARSAFNQIDSWAYYHAVYLPSMTYTFPSSSLTPCHCKALQIPFKKVLLPRYGFNWNTPNAVVYGPTEYGGLGLHNLTVEQGIAQVHTLLACLRSGGVASKLALIAIAWGQCLSGISSPILLDPTVALPHLEPMVWLPSVRLFLAQARCRIEISQTFVPPLQRQHDRFLMDDAIAQAFRPVELKLLNAYRLFLGVTLLSNIVTADGWRLSEEALHGIPLSDSRVNGYTPYQEQPGAKALRLWKKFLKGYLASVRSRRLKQRLGRWLSTGNSTFRQWKYYVCLESARVYCRDGEVFTVWSAQDPNHLRATGMQLAQIPNRAVPAEVIDCNGRLQLQRTTIAICEPAEAVDGSFHAFVDTLPTWERCLLQTTSFVGTAYSFAGAVTADDAPPLFVCSDGSAPEFRGTFGATCYLATGQQLATLNGPAPGYRTSSYRAEGYGLLAVLRLVFRTCEFAGQLLPSQLTVYTDSKSSLQTMEARLKWIEDFPYTTMSADWDLHQAITATLRLFPGIVYLTHVKGHQDATVPEAMLTLPARMNVEADRLAAQYLYPPGYSSTLAPLIDGSTAALHGPLGTIASNYRQVLRNLCSEQLTVEYLLERNAWTLSDFDQVAWQVHGHVLRSFYSRRHFVVKFIHGWLPLGKLQNKYASHCPQSCPACTAELEDWVHFLRCPTTIEWRGAVFEALCSSWRKQQVDPVLQSILLAELREWLRDSQCVHPDYPQRYQLLIHTQRRIGIEHLFYGRFAKEWLVQQDVYLGTLASPSANLSGRSFVASTIAVLWDHAHQLWKTRNGYKHGVDHASMEAAAVAAAKTEITELYAIRHLVQPRDREVFYDTVEAHFADTSTSVGLRSWLTTWKPALLRSVERARATGTNRLHSIREYFTPR